MISSCPNYLHADVSDGEDFSRHQQEVTSGQLVTWSLVPGTVDSDVSSECHLRCPPPFTYRGSVLLGRHLRVLCLKCGIFLLSILMIKSSLSKSILSDSSRFVTVRVRSKSLALVV